MVQARQVNIKVSFSFNMICEYVVQYKKKHLYTKVCKMCCTKIFTNGMAFMVTKYKYHIITQTIKINGGLLL